jgi:DNA-binding NtrC family response regulator
LREPVENNPQSPMSEKKISIVIIDDEEDLCFLLSGMLAAQGLKTTSFHTLMSGMDGVKKLQPDWVIIDNNLPDGLGWDKVNEIIDLVPHVHVIKISANPDSDRTGHRDFIHYLVKPINVNSVINLIRGSAGSAV